MLLVRCLHVLFFLRVLPVYVRIVLLSQVMLLTLDDLPLTSACQAWLGNESVRVRPIRLASK
jgi:hypothetical protein